MTMENKATCFEKKKKRSRAVPVAKLTSEQCVHSERMSKKTPVCKGRIFDCGHTKGY